MEELNQIPIRELKDYFFRTDNEIFEFVREMKSPYTAGWVYCLLSRMADRYTQRCYPSQSYIAKQTGVSRVQVSRAIRALEKRRIISVVRLGGMQNEYVLLHKKLWSTKDVEPVSIRCRSCSSQSGVPVSGRYTNKNKKTDLFKKARQRDTVTDIRNLSKGMRII